MRDFASRGDIEQAAFTARHIVIFWVNCGDAYHDAGVCYAKMGMHSDAVGCFERSAILEAEQQPQLVQNYAVSLIKLGQIDRAIESLKKVNWRFVISARIQREIGVVFQEVGEISRALDCFDRSDVLSPSDGLARYFSSLLLLSHGLFNPGWYHHERRWRSVQFVDPVKKIRPILTGRARFSSDRDLTARVLVWGEQGVGDEVMFGSMLREFRGWCGKMLVQMDKRLIPLFRRSLPQDVEFYERGSVVSEDLYDSHIPIGSLGLHLRPSRESFEGHRGAYLKADPDRVRALRESFGLTDGERLIGVSWRSSNPETGAGRSLPLWELAQVLGGEGRRLVNLQYGSVQEEIAEAQARCGIRVEQVPGVDCQNDLDGLAALIMACDEVVSIGNATAHLAGALGQKTTVLLPYSPSWRWTTVGKETPWYRSLLLLRQHASDEWAGLLDEAQRQLVATG